MEKTPRKRFNWLGLAVEIVKLVATFLAGAGTNEML